MAEFSQTEGYQPDRGPADDIVARLRHAQRLREPWDMNKEPLFGEAADEIERLRAEARAFTVRPDEVLVLISPDGLTPAEAKALKDGCPELHGRIIVIGNMEARRAA